jgi:hypothetical protein
MSAQRTPTQSHRRTAFVAVALLLVALTVGAVTAVNLFPTSASERSLAEPARPSFAALATDRESVLERFRAQERADPAQAARVQQTWTDRLNGQATDRVQQTWTDRLNGQATDRVQQTWTDRLNGQAAEAGALP